MKKKWKKIEPPGNRCSRWRATAKKAVLQPNRIAAVDGVSKRWYVNLNHTTALNGAAKKEHQNKWLKCPVSKRHSTWFDLKNKHKTQQKHKNSA